MPDTSFLPTSFDEDEEFFSEAIFPKLWRRCREEPLIPIGVGVTAWAVTNASRAMKRGDRRATNKYFRRRLYAQAFTIFSLWAGSVYYQKEFLMRREQKEKIRNAKREEKRQRWLRELEMRDEEEKSFNARMAAARKAQDAKGVTELVAEKTQQLKDAAARTYR